MLSGFAVLGLWHRVSAIFSVLFCLRANMPVMPTGLISWTIWAWAWVLPAGEWSMDFMPFSSQSSSRLVTFLLKLPFHDPWQRIILILPLTSQAHWASPFLSLKVVPARAQAGPPCDLLYSPKLSSPLLFTLSTDFTMAWIQSWSLAKILLILDRSHFIFCSLFTVFLLNTTSWLSWAISLTSTLFLNLYILPQLEWKNSTKWFHILKKKKSESSLQHLTQRRHLLNLSWWIFNVSVRLGSQLIY